MKPGVWIVFFIGAISLQAQQPKDPFAALEYDSVVAYNFALRNSGWRGHIGTIIYEENKLHPTTILPGVRLNAKQKKILLKTVTANSTYGGDVAACFDPRLAFIFYKDNKIAGYIDICFACNALRSKPEIPAMCYHKVKIEDENEDYSICRYGFSKKGRKLLKKICGDLNMPYCAEEGKSLFD